jgi:hypothetical protein
MHSFYNFQSHSVNELQTTRPLLTLPTERDHTGSIQIRHFTNEKIPVATKEIKIPSDNSSTSSTILENKQRNE